jgi:hypothetical protein
MKPRVTLETQYRIFPLYPGGCAMYVKGSHDPYKTFQLNPKGRKRKSSVQSHIVGESAKSTMTGFQYSGSKAIRT